MFIRQFTLALVLICIVTAGAGLRFWNVSAGIAHRIGVDERAVELARGVWSRAPVPVDPRGECRAWHSDNPPPVPRRVQVGDLAGAHGGSCFPELPGKAERSCEQFSRRESTILNSGVFSCPTLHPSLSV